MKREKIVTEKIVHWSLSLTGQKLVLICSRRGLHRQMFGCVFFVSVNQVLVRLWARLRSSNLTGKRLREKLAASTTLGKYVHRRVWKICRVMSPMGPTMCGIWRQPYARNDVWVDLLGLICMCVCRDEACCV